MPRFQWRQWLVALATPCPATTGAGQGVRANLNELRLLFADELARRDHQAWLAALERPRARGGRGRAAPAATPQGDVAAG